MTRHLRLAALTALASASLALMAGTGHAQGSGDPAPVSGDIVVKEGFELRGSLDGEPWDAWANVLGLTPHGSEETLQVYCIDIRTELDHESPYAEGEWEESGVANLEQVRWVLFNGHPNVTAEHLLTEAGTAPAESWDWKTTTRVAYAGTQAAVWHFTDGYELDEEPVIGGTEEQNEAVWAIYQHLTAAPERLPDPSEFHIELDGVEEAAYDDGAFGPYTIRSNAGPVAMSAEGGGLIDGSGKAVESLKDGQDFYIVLDEDSEQITISGQATYDLPVGRVFMATTDESLSGDAINPLKSGESQKLILAQPRESAIPAEWAFALQLPEAETPTPPQEAAPKLPATGANLTVAFAGGLALLIGGLTVMTLARRRAPAE